MRKPTRILERRIAVVLLLACVVPLFVMTARSSPNQPLFLFKTTPSPERWEIVNDGVMGGVSNSRVVFTNGTAVFSGEVSLENNGGFASIRSRPRLMDCSGCDTFLIRVRGDGKRYKFTARTSSRWDSPQYQIPIQTTAGQWQDVRLPFSEFNASFRGRALPAEPPLDPSKLMSVGFLIADQQAGPFQLEIQSIQTARPSSSASQSP